MSDGPAICRSCGVPLIHHRGIYGTCAELQLLRHALGGLIWRTDFPPTDRPVLMAWRYSPDDETEYAVVTMEQVDTAVAMTDDGDVEFPLYLPVPVADCGGMALEFDGKTLFAWADLDCPPSVLAQWPVYEEEE